MVLGRERQRGLEKLHRPVGAIDRDFFAQKLVPRSDAARRHFLHPLLAEKLNRSVRRLRTFAGMNNRDTGVTLRQRPDNVARLEGVGGERDRPDRASLGIEPRSDGVADGDGSVGGAIDAPVICRDKLGAPLLGVSLALEEPLLPLASSRIAPVQDVARLLDDRAVLQFATTDAAREIDVERHARDGDDQKQNENTTRKRAQLFRSRTRLRGQEPFAGTRENLLPTARLKP